MGIRSENIYEVPQKKYAAFYDASFVVGDSPVTHDVNTVLTRNAFSGYIHNYGAGALLYQISQDGTTFGNSVLLPPTTKDVLDGFDIDSLKITHSADTSYSIRVK